MAQIPEKSVSTKDRVSLGKLEEDLKRVIFGQDEAIQKLSNSIMMSRAGLGEEEKPIGSFLFSGPTGVGKTEVSRQLAKILGVELISLDMFIHGTTYCFKTYWCSSWICWLRSRWSVN